MTRAAIALLLLLAACGRAEEEPTVEEQFDRQSAEIENRAAILEAEAANMVADQERALDAEIEALRNQPDEPEANQAAETR